MRRQDNKFSLSLRSEIYKQKYIKILVIRNNQRTKSSSQSYTCNFLSYSTENIQESLHSCSLVNIYNKKQLKAAENLKSACTLNSFPQHWQWLPLGSIMKSLSSWSKKICQHGSKQRKITHKNNSDIHNMREFHCCMYDRCHWNVSSATNTKF